MRFHPMKCSMILSYFLYLILYRKREWYLIDLPLVVRGSEKRGFVKFGGNGGQRCLSYKGLKVYE